MTQEMAKVMIKQYTVYMNMADKFWDKGDTDKYDYYLQLGFTLNRVLGELGYEFKKAFSGEYVIVEK